MACVTYSARSAVWWANVRHHPSLQHPLGGLSMETSPAVPSERLVGIARTISLLILLLMVIAGLYGATMAARFYTHITV